MSYPCSGCAVKESICICQCSNFAMCDDCFGQHSAYFTDFIHYPSLLSQKSGPNLNLYMASAYESIAKLHQSKEELLNNFINQVTQDLYKIKNESLAEEREIQQKLFSLLTDSCTPDGLESITNHIKSKKLSIESLLNDKTEEHFVKMKKEMIQSIKSLEKHDHCFRCFKKSQTIELDCKHLICKDCFNNLIASQTNSLFVLNSIEQKDILCEFENCFSKISDEIQRNNIIDYENHKLRADEREVFSCNKCRVKGKKDIFQTSCFHYCEECAVNIIRSGSQECPHCSKPISKAEFEAFALKVKKCEGCFREKNWIKDFPNRLCKHFVCIECLSDNGESQQCIVEEDCPNFNLSKEEFESIFKIKCELCPSKIYKSKPYLYGKNCECRICEICQVKSGDERSSFCVKCGIKFNPGTSKIIEKKYKEILNEPTRTCPVCFVDFKISEIVSFMSCEHEICRFCIDGYVTNCMQDITLLPDVDQCMVCQRSFDVNQIELIIGKGASERLNFFFLQKQNIQLVDCPNCKTEFEPGFTRKVECINEECKNIFCKQCKEEYHDDGDCDEVFLQSLIDQMKYMEGGVTQCPRCRFPYIKDPKNCEHVDCIQPGCGISFCFQCACIRSPTMEHGNHYHRKECKFFDDYNGDDDKARPKCTECTRLGLEIGKKPCSRPKSLRIPRLVAKDEVE